MKSFDLNIRRRKFRKFALYMASVLVMATTISCTDNALRNSTSPQTDKVYIAIDGMISEYIAAEGDGLVSTSLADVPFLRENEYQISIDLGDKNQLKCYVYNSMLGQPFEQAWQYSAYPMEEIVDRNAYTVVQYIDSKGDIKYSTTFESSPPEIQVNVMEILTTSESGFSARLKDLTLFETHPDLRQSEKTGGYITIAGTFTSSN